MVSKFRNIKGQPGIPTAKVRDWWTDFGPGKTRVGYYTVLNYDPETEDFWKFRTNLDDYDFTLMNDAEMKVFLWRMWDYYGHKSRDAGTAVR